MTTTIVGTGHHLPLRVVTNDAIEESSCDFDRSRSGVTLDAWVRDRIGVVTRRVVEPGQGTADLATGAARAALADAGIDAADVDLIVLSTFTSDHRLPQSVSLVQEALGTTAKCFQLEAACAGFLDGLLVAGGLMATAGYRTALVIHSETMSAVMDPEQFLLRSIFADGAGAAVVREDPRGRAGLLAHHTATEGDKAFWLRAGGGTCSPITAEALASGSHYMRIDYKAIYDFAVTRMCEAVRIVLRRAGATLDDVDWFVAHQTGVNIIRDVAARLGVDHDRFLMTIDHTGNTSGATIPIALDTFSRRGVIRPDDLLVLPTVGAGMNWGAAAARWADAELLLTPDECARRRATRTIDLTEAAPRDVRTPAPVLR